MGTPGRNKKKKQPKKKAYSTETSFFEALLSKCILDIFFLFLFLPLTVKPPSVETAQSHKGEQHLRPPNTSHKSPLITCFSLHHGE